MPKAFYLAVNSMSTVEGRQFYNVEKGKKSMVCLNFYVLRDMSTYLLLLYLLLLSLTNRMRVLLFSILATAYAAGTPRAGTARSMMPYAQDRRLRPNFGMKEGQAVGMQEFEDETH
jgi:hypothetical protein